MATDRDALDELAKVSRMDAVHPIRHFLYVPTEEQAREVVLAISARDYEVAEPYPIFDSWCVVAKTFVVPHEETIQELRKTFTEMTDQYDGDYDGWEAEVQPLTKQAASDHN